MKIGVTMFATDRLASPARIAQEIEARGLESLFLPEHSHIPTSRRTIWPGSRRGHNDPLPDYYAHLYDQVVALSMAAAVTNEITLGTSVTLLPQHDPIWMAKQIATLDHLSGGRVVMGIGFGWNVEQGENHGVRFDQRRQRTEECVGVMRSLWRQEVASFQGETLELAPSWAYPKPMQPGGPPILIGGMGPRTFDAIARYADGWMPITRRGSLVGRIEPLRQAFEEHNRDPNTIRIVVSGASESADDLANLQREGVEHATLTIWSEDTDEVWRMLDEFANIAEKARERFH
ncbi:MAG: LLM class F420-dependent oxidoreductase [Pseudomonadales bacterium]